MSRTINTNLIRLKLQRRASCGSCILNALFLPKCLPNFHFKRRKFAHEFQKYTFCNRYHVASVSVLLFCQYTNNVNKYFADLCDFVCVNSKVRAKVRTVLVCQVSVAVKEIVCAQFKQNFLLQLPSSPKITVTLLDFTTTLSPRFLTCRAPTCQKWFYPHLGSSHEAGYTLYSYIVYIKIRRKMS